MRINQNIIAFQIPGQSGITRMCTRRSDPDLRNLVDYGYDLSFRLELFVMI